MNDDDSNDQWSDIQEKTKQMLEKQGNCLHINRSYWLVFDDLYVSLKARNGQNIPLKPAWYCLDCGKDL